MIRCEKTTLFLKITTVKSLCNDSCLGVGVSSYNSLVFRKVCLKVTLVPAHNACNMQHREIENLNINQYPVKYTEMREDDF